MSNTYRGWKINYNQKRGLAHAYQATDGVNTRSAASRVGIERAIDQVVDISTRAIKSIACGDSPDGQHHVIVDLEYDHTGKSKACQYCGLTPQQIKG